MTLKIANTVALITAMTAAFGQTPHFIDPATYPTGGSSKYVAVGDFNRDGYRDMVTYESADQSLTLLFGTAGGTFQAPVSRPVAIPASSIVAADLNGDGFADVVLSSTSSVAVLLNAGDGTFAPPAFYGAGFLPNYVTAADVNQDGALDLIVAGLSGVSVLRGSGTGKFSPPLVLPNTLNIFWVGVADFNGDGNLDLVTDGSPGQFYAGKGDGTFAPPVPSNTAIPFRAAIGDFNGDGKMDMAYSSSTFNQERLTGQQVTILLGTGGGQFLQAVNMFFQGGGTSDVAAGDFDGDGRADVAIWLSLPARLYVVTDPMSARLTLIPAQLSAAGNAALTAGDADGNGSSDLMLLNATSVTLLRDTHGNPPLLAVTALSPASATGGSPVEGTVTLGGPAPAGGAAVTLSSSNPALAYPLENTVMIPAGLSSATFSVVTRPVDTSTPVIITATYNSVPQTATLTLVAPYALSGLTITPAIQFGGFNGDATISLSGPADAAATVSLSTSNALAVSVPATVIVPPGATSVTFPVAFQPVPADTVASISAAMGGVSKSVSVTVLRPLDSVRITRADYTLRSAQLRVEATSTNATATLTVWNAGTGALIGTLPNNGGGKYGATFTVSGPVQSISVKSSLGGIATSPTIVK